MSELHKINLKICGVHEWTIFSPVPDVVIKWESVGGRRREWPINLLSLEKNDRKTRKFHSLEQRLYRAMYPVIGEYAMWLETPTGDRIAGQRTADPQFGEWSITRIERTNKKDGTHLIWIGDEMTQAHKIDFGVWDNRPMILTVPVNLWPPTMFLVGNNQIRAIPLVDISLESLRRLAPQLLEIGKEFAYYEEAHYFLTGSRQPSMPPWEKL